MKVELMERRASVGNRLLAALPSEDLALLAPHLQKVSLEQDAVVARSGDRRDRVYFPHSGAISFMLGLPNGETIATALIGRDGALGALSVLGGNPSLSSVTAVVRVGGTASQISVERFQAAYMGSNAIRHVVQAHTRSILIQFQHVAACNGLHPVEARVARWLLHLHDRTEGNILSLTQETLSQLLGVRRTTVTVEVAKLRALGAVRSDRRGSIEVDRVRLKQAACECYDIMRRQTDQIIPDDAARPRLHVASGNEPHGGSAFSKGAQ
jgi:CRP-like cAMP-binding protein